MLLICATISMVLLATLIRAMEKTWMSPGALFALLWCGYSLTIWLFDMPAEVLVLGLLWIAASGVLIHVGCLVGRGPSARLGVDGPSIPVPNSREFPWLKSITLGFSVIGLGYAGMVLVRSGDSFSKVMSLGYLNQLVMFNRATFVYGPERLGVEELIAFGFFYAAPLFGGLLFGFDASVWARTVSIISVLAPSGVGLLYGSRMGALFGGSFWISAYMASRVLGCARRERALGKSLTGALLAAGCFIIGIPALVIFIRYEEGQFDSLRIFLSTAGDILSFLPSFAVSLNEEGFKFFTIMYGEITFGRLFEILTLRFGDHFAYDAIDVGYTSSNVFTIFRGLIDDFGHLGALVITLCFGMIGGLAYKKVLLGRLAFLPVLVAVYAGVFTSFSFSLFSYSTPTFGLFLFGAYVVGVSACQSFRVHSGSSRFIVGS